MIMVGRPVHKMKRLVLLALIGFVFLSVLFVVWMVRSAPA